MTVTQAARQFSELIDDIGRTGQSVTLERYGQPVAVLSPVTSAEPSRMTTRSSDRSFPAIEAILRPNDGRDHILRALLAGIEDQGCSITPPRGSKRDDYVNVYVGGVKGRIASINVRTGRIEFQGESWPALGHLYDGFVRLPAGNKAAHPVARPADLEVVLNAVRLEIARRR